MDRAGWNRSLTPTSPSITAQAGHAYHQIALDDKHSTDCQISARLCAIGVDLVAPMAHSWHSCGMARVRVSTTVDESLLEEARRVRADSNDAALLDEALAALLARHRAAQIDAAYAAYDAHPIDEPDEWGDLASFREAAALS